MEFSSGGFWRSGYLERWLTIEVEIIKRAVLDEQMYLGLRMWERNFDLLKLF